MSGVVWCVAAACLGVLLGYVFNWAIRHNPKPDGKEVAALVAVLVGGAAVTLVRELVGCPTALAWYLIGLPLGFLSYLIALHFGWERIQALLAQGKLKGAPLFPWRV